MSENLPKIEHAALSVNQGAIITLLLAGFILNAPGLVALVAAAMLLGTAFKRPGFGFMYHTVFKPLGWVKPDIFPDNPEPHRFAQGFGGVVAAASALALWLGAVPLGWALSWLVITLAALNLFVGFCAGCAVYYWLNRLKIPGFYKSAPQGFLPGMRPKAKSS